MKRLRNWEPKLNKAILAMRGKKFEYGVSDCAMMVCDVVKAITGVDPAEDLRGTYSEFDVPNLEGMAEEIANELLLEEVHPTRAQRGDVVLMDVPEPKGKKNDVITIIGVVDMTGSKVVFPLIGGGIVRHSVTKGRRAWRI